LSHSIDKCIAHLRTAWEDGTHFSDYATQSRQLIDKQIRQKQGYCAHRDPTLATIHQHLTVTVERPTDVRRLTDSKIRLDRHRDDVNNANAALSLSHSSTNMPDMNQLLLALQDVLIGLGNVSGRLARAQARHQERFEREMEEGEIKVARV
jgi:hypothetical protein